MKGGFVHLAEGPAFLTLHEAVYITGRVIRGNSGLD
jgi:hypothetical protein